MLLLYRLLLKVDVAEAALDGRNALRVVEQRMQRGGGWRVKQASEKRQDVQKCYCQLNFKFAFQVLEIANIWPQMSQEDTEVRRSKHSCPMPDLSLYSREKAYHPTLRSKPLKMTSWKQA